MHRPGGPHATDINLFFLPRFDERFGGALHVEHEAIANLQAGDVITEFNGLPTRTSNEFNRRLRAVKPRSKVPLKFYRGNTEQTVEVVLGHRWED